MLVENGALGRWFRRLLTSLTEAISPVMSMHQTLSVLNRMVAKKVIEGYAIAGAVAAYNYVEPTVTEDLDVLIPAVGGSSGLVSISPILDYLRSQGYSDCRHEGVVIEGWPVQFLPVASSLDAEAFRRADTVSISFSGGMIETRVLRPEYLIASALTVGGPKDMVRINQFIEEDAVDLEALKNVIQRFHLESQWQGFLRRTGQQDMLPP